MKRKIAVVLLTALTALNLAACGSSDQAKEANVKESLADVNLEKYVTKLGDYKGLEISGTKQEITDEYVDSYIEFMLENSKEPVEVTDRPAKEGDVVNIDYVGKKDGVAFDGGTAQGYDLELGSHTFIDGFEDGLIGVNVGDTVDLDLTFPENYGNSDLAGAAVVFTVTVNKIGELQAPELNEDYVKSLGIEGCETVEQFKQVAREALESNADATYQSELQTAAMDALMAKCELSDDVPEEVFNYYRSMIEENLENEAKAKNMSVTDFVTSYYGMTQEQYNAQLDEGAKSSARQAMVSKLIAQKEGLVATDDDLDKAINENYANFGYESAEDFKTKGNPEDYRDYLTTRNVLEFLVDNAVITEKETEVSTEFETEAE